MGRNPDLVILDLVFDGDQQQLSGGSTCACCAPTISCKRSRCWSAAPTPIALRDRAGELAEDERLVCLAKPFTLAELEVAVTWLFGDTRGEHST